MRFDCYRGYGTSPPHGKDQVETKRRTAPNSNNSNDNDENERTRPTNTRGKAREAASPIESFHGDAIEVTLHGNGKIRRTTLRLEKIASH